MARVLNIVSRVALGSTIAMLGASCSNVEGMDPQDPARGPGQLVGNGDPVSSGDFHGGTDEMPVARVVVMPPEDGAQLDCGPSCRSYCDELGLENPVNIGICPSLWGVGLESRPVKFYEACRRLFVDMIGRYPTAEESESTCGQPTWGDVVMTLLDSDEFVFVNQRRWADIMLYNNRAVNFERAYDMDELVGKAYEGRVSWDEFAAVTSAHPMLVRRHDTPNDRAEFGFRTFLGRPPYENERGDLGRLFNVWTNGYWDHPHVGVVPDAFIDFPCLTNSGEEDPETIGECTSILWGKQSVVLKPDEERLVHGGEQDGTMWAGFMKPSEWKKVQLPGRIIASQPAFWEHAAEEVLGQYLGYDLAASAPEVVHELVEYVLQYNGDIRALHYAVATSFPYLQSARGDTPTSFPWTTGPLKQVPVEGWIDTFKMTADTRLSQCDHRLPHPEDYTGPDSLEEAGGWAFALVNNSRWEVDKGDERRVVGNYRNLARTLGGCPSNEVASRFTTVSVLNTAVQESFVAEVCGIGDVGGGINAISTGRLLPEGVDEDTAVDDDIVAEILQHQTRLFLARNATDSEIEETQLAAQECSAPCRASAFARPLCFAVLSSAEMLFY